MKVNKWTLGLAAAGLVSLPAGLQADEKLNPLLTAVTPTTVNGYVNTSIHWNPGTGNRSVPAYSFNKGKQDGFNLDVVSLALEKPLDEAQWAAGYKAELLFGPDANTLATLSSASTANGGVPSDFAIKQAYLALRAPVGNGLDFKVGVWDTPIGYETFDAHKNPNYSRSWGYTIEPTTHTGVLMSYQLCKFASASAGIANTFGPAINARANPPKAESYKTYMASLGLTAPEDWGFVSGSTLSAVIINGFNSGTGDGGSDQTSFYVGATLNTPVKGLKFGASYDYFGTTDERFSTNYTHNTTFYANALAAYTSYAATEKLSLHLRGEYAWSDTALIGSTANSANLPGGNSEVVSLTTTLQYDLWQNVLSRLEFRWDHLAGDDSMAGYGGDLSKPSSTNGKRNSYLLALNLIYKF